MGFNYMNAVRRKKFPAKFKWQGQFSVFSFQFFSFQLLVFSFLLLAVDDRSSDFATSLLVFFLF